MKIFFIFFLYLTACGQDNDITSNPVEDFNIEKYLGTWYEIARTNNRFEKGCSNVTATYAKRGDGGINVFNHCIVDGKEKSAKGRAYFKENQNIASLKVTFFWPFYGNYNVVYIDKNYQYAIIDGGSEKYLWILSRSKDLDKKIIEKLLRKVRQNGFDTNKLIYAKHDNI